MNSNEKIRVENSYIFNDSIDHQTYSIINKNQIDIDDDSRTDLTLNHFDVQLQVNNGQLQQVIRYGVFSSILPNDMKTFKINQSSQTIEPEMDMDGGGDSRRNGNSNNYSQRYNENNNSGGYRRNQQPNGSSGNGGSADGNGSNPNRNNNNSRR
jgi:hypothetical protein